MPDFVPNTNNAESNYELQQRILTLEAVAFITDVPLLLQKMAILEAKLAALTE